jgi:hypothetical protein
METGLKADKLTVGKMYQCIISGEKGLITESQRQTGTKPSGKKDKEKNDILEPVFEDVKALRSFYKDPNGKPSYLYSEVNDGQMKEIEA